MLGMHSMQESYILHPIIKGLMLTWSRVVFLQKFAINWHHKYITFWIYQAICFIWVYWLYHKWSFPLGLKIFFRLICQYHGFSDSQDEVAFRESPLLNFLVEGSKNLSLIKLDLLLSLQALTVQSFQLLESQSILFLICHLRCQSNTHIWDLDL